MRIITEKSRRVDPPKNERMATVMMVVAEVSKVRDSVALIASFMMFLIEPVADQQVFTNPVEDDDGVVDRVTGDGEDGADVDERQLAAQQDDDADGDDDVVQDGDETAEREGELETHGDVDQDADQAQSEGDDRVPEERAADERGDLLLAAVDHDSHGCRPCPLQPSFRRGRGWSRGVW